MIFYKSRPIPLLEAGPERELMAFLLEKVKQTKGLTTALVQQAGVNAKWLKPDEPRNFPVKRLLRIVLHTMDRLNREECKRKACAMIDNVYDHILPAYSDQVDHQAGKRKQRPPSIRRLNWRRYRRSKNILITQIIYSIKSSINYEPQSRTTLYPAFQSF